MISNILYALLSSDYSIRVYQSFAATCYTSKIITINVFYMFPIIFNAFSDPLYSKLCWHNRRVPNFRDSILVYVIDNDLV